ncbi:MAG: hypothetical protein GX139_13220, partial [Armatimonadetes bacterium]|nr:hypothetical protein [Armatimonadota bacterium]
QLSTTASGNPTGLGIAGGVGANKGSVMVSEMSGSNVVWACYMNAAGTGGSGQTISLTKQDQQLGESVWNGTNHVVVWADKRYGALSSLIYAARVQQDGTVLDPQGVMVSSASGTQSQPAIAWSPTENMYMVVWRQSTALAGNYDIKAMRLDANLNKIGYEITVTSFDMDRTNPAVAWNGSNFLVVWADNRPIDGLWDIYGSRVSTTGVPSSSVYICTDAGTQILPAVTAGDSGNCLVTWQDKWQMKYEYAIGTSFKGTNTRNWTTVPATSTEPAGTATEVTASVSPPMTIGLTYYVSVRATNRDGTKSDVGCSDGIKIVSPGSPVPPAPSGMSGQSVPSTPTVVDDGVTQTSRTTLHASWSSSYDNFGEPAIMARVVPATGNLGTVKRVSSTAAGKSEPKVAYDGSNYLVVWSQATTSVHGALLTSANNRITPDPAGDILITTGSAKGHHPSVAWDGSKYVVTWEDKRSYTNNKTDIYAARISDDGTVQDNDGGMLISQAPRAETTPIISSISPLQSMAFYTYEKYSSYRLQAREIWTTQPPPPEYPLEEAKQLPDGTVVSIIGLPVTAGNDQFAGIFYIEDKQRIQGIKVVWNESTIFEGMVVTVSGTITTANGERQINATSVTVSPTPEVFLVPFGIRPAYMGGVAAGLVPGVVGGVMGPRGANNIGLLVKCWGVVQNAAGGYFELREPNGEVVRVKTPSALPTEGLMYAVTGISSCEPVTGGYGSLLLARKAVDVQALQ